MQVSERICPSVMILAWTSVVSSGFNQVQRNVSNHNLPPFSYTQKTV